MSEQTILIIAIENGRVKTNLKGSTNLNQLSLLITELEIKKLEVMKKYIARKSLKSNLNFGRKNK